MLSDIFSVIALLLSMISLYWQWKDKRPHLKISPGIESKTLPITSDGMGGFIPTETATLTVYLANSSEKPVHVTGVYLCLPKKEPIPLDEFHALYQGLFRPFTIEPLRGQAFTVWGEKLARMLQDNGLSDSVEARVLVKDEVGKEYLSKPIRLSISQLHQDEPTHTESAA